MPPDPRTSPDGSPRVLAGPLGAAPPAPQVPRALRTASTTGFKGDSPALNPYKFKLLVTTQAAGNMQDEAARVRFLKTQGFDPRRLAVSYQVHGKEIGIIRKPEDIPGQRVQGIDGWVAHGVSGASLGIFVADCLPVFLLPSPGSLSHACLLHAGWRGLERGIIEEAFQIVKKEFEIGSEDLVAAIGPHIRSCCYEVGQEVADRFPEHWSEKKDGKIYLDLEKGVLEKLSLAGIPEVAVSSQCTKCTPEPSFFSRRKGIAGTQMALLSLVPGEKHPFISIEVMGYADPTNAACEHGHARFSSA